MKYKQSLGHPLKSVCLLHCRLSQLEGTFRFHVPESTSGDLNAIANSTGPDENIHKEQPGQGQLCLPSYTTLAVLTMLNCNQS